MCPLLPPSVVRFLRREGITASPEPLPGDGSNRKFFRLREPQESFVLILPQEGNYGLKEAAAYVSIGRFLRQKGLPVPQIFAYEEETGYILVEDLGDLKLQDLSPQEKRAFYPQVLQTLVAFQRAREGFDLSWTLEGPRYDAKLMWEKEALYFVESFLKNFCSWKEEEALLSELRALWQQAQTYLEEEVLLHRDFQSRNIMLKEGKVYLLDFQGARLGPPAYDLASLLFDPYAALSPEVREELFNLYLHLAGRDHLPGYQHLALFRLLQALGAFAKLTRAGKAWFAQYIPPALATLRDLLEEHFPQAVHLRRVIQQVGPS